jgi:hypothetical protein
VISLLKHLDEECEGAEVAYDQTARAKGCTDLIMWDASLCVASFFGSSEYHTNVFSAEII